MELEHEADGPAAPFCQPGIVKQAGRLAGDFKQAGVGRSSRLMRLSSVLLSEPDGPLSATDSAVCKARLIAVQHLGLNIGADVVAAVDVAQAQHHIAGLDPVAFANPNRQHRGSDFSRCPGALGH